MRVSVGFALVLAAALGSTAQAAQDRFVRESPRSAVATCLRPTGAPGVVGLLGPLERGGSPYDLLRVSPGGVSLLATARLGVLDDCPAVAADPSGHAVVAAPLRVGRSGMVVRAALAEPGGGFGAPVDVARTRSHVSHAAAAVSPRGDVVVAWAPARYRRRSTRGLTRVLAAVRPADGTFGPPQALTPWRRGEFAPMPVLRAGMDASGAATVAWAQPIPDRGRIPDLSTVEATAAPPGGDFGPAQALAKAVQEVNGVSLAVAPDGRALLAHDGQGVIEVFERLAGRPRFTRLRRLVRRRGLVDWRDPEVALAPDGSSVIAWRTGYESDVGAAGVLVASRRSNGSLTPPTVVQRRKGTAGFAEGVVVATGGGPLPPPDLDNAGLRAAILPSGRYLLAWGVGRRLPLGDRPLAARMVQGQAGGRPEAGETAGCPCRSVNGLVPLPTAEGELLLAYTDNVTRAFGFGLEFARGSGRLHLAASGPPAAGPDPPRVSVRPPRRAMLDYGDRLPVRVGCDRPCDVRAYVVGGRGRARGLGVASLPAAGNARILLVPGYDEQLAPPSEGRARVVVHGYAANGRRPARISAPVALRRKPLPPLPRPVDVRAVRRDGSVTVTWRTRRPAQRVSFEVTGRFSRRFRFPLDEESVEGRGRRRFSARLRVPPEVSDIGPISFVAVSVIRGRPPFDRVTVVVPVLAY